MFQHLGNDPEIRGATRDFDLFREMAGVTGVGDLGLDEIGSTRGNRVGQFHQQITAHGLGHLPPFPTQGGGGGVHRVIDIFGKGLMHGGDL